MFDNWKKLVKPGDIVLHLGDIAVWYPIGTDVAWGRKVSKLPGQKYLIRGNHDKHFTDKQWKKFGFTVIPEFRQNKVSFSHEQMIDGEWEVNIHGHSHHHAPFGLYTKFGRLYYNASIEGMKYKPRRLGSILKEIKG